MATDPPNITAPTSADVDLWKEYGNQTAQADENLSKINITGGLVHQMFGILGDTLAKAGTKLEDIGTLTGEQAAKFGVLTAAAIGAQKSFANLAGVDLSRLSAFTDQLDQLMDVIKQGPATKQAIDFFESWGNRMKASGIAASQVDRAVRELSVGVTDTARAILMGADNTARLQNALMQTVLQVSGADSLFGKISDTITGVGDDFQNLNDVTQMYQKTLIGTMTATHLTIDQVATYANEINKMPGGFKALMEGMQIAGNQTNILTASIQLATGAGRSQEEVFTDMKQAMLQYAITGEGALRFSARMTEVADTLHAQVGDVQSALRESADAFKMFVTQGADADKMTQGLADSMKDYVYQLTSIGMPAQNAIEMFKNYTNVVKNMTMGQQAFISSMSGGPGGLRGAFAMDAMMRRGDFEAVRRQVETTIRRMTGPLVSLDEAQKSESAAAQYTRQIQLLQQGPLGALARTRPEAEALLQAMKDGRKLPATGKTADQSLQETIQRGQKWEELSHTELVDIRQAVQAIAITGGAANLITVRGATTGSTGALGGGVGGAGAGINPDTQEALLQGQRAGITPAPGSAMDLAFRAAGQAIKDIPMALKDTGTSIGESLGLTSAFSPLSDYAPAGKQLGRNIPASTSGSGTATTGGRAATGHPIAGGAPGHPVPVMLAPGSTIHVNFSGSCPHCGRDVNTTEVGRTVAPQALTTGR